ncbi:MAG: EAL domain-containing protein [Saccharospirillum sp.]|nr:EAL domain-containing protein [Saccharospirillum sp.]
MTNTTLVEQVKPLRLEFRLSWRPSLLLGAAFYLCLSLAELLSPIDADAYLFWPVTAFAITALRHRPLTIVALMITFWLWGTQAGMKPLWMVAQLLTLIGPLLYLRYSKAGAPSLSMTKRRLHDLRNMVFLAVIPASLIGTLLLVSNDNSLAFEDGWLILGVYLAGELTGLILLIPVLGHWMRTARQPLQWYHLLLTLATLAIPMLLDALGQHAFAQPSLFLTLPFVTWLAHSTNRGTLSHALLILFIGHLSLAYFGLGGYTPMTQLHQLILLCLLLVSAFMTVDVLHATRMDRDEASREIEWLSLHDHRVKTLNERGLLNWATQQASLNGIASVLLKPINKDIYLETLNWEQLGHIERQVLQQLSARLPSATRVAKVSDLVFVAMAPAASVNAATLRPLLQLRVVLDQTSLSMDFAIAGIHRLSENMTDNLAKLHTLWGMARQQSSERLQISHDDKEISARKELLLRFQQYREAVETDRLALWLQPIQSLANDKIEKFEVLARIELDGAIVSPGDFLPVFQRFNYLNDFDRQVIQTTFSKLASLQSGLDAPGVININISGATLADKALMAWIREKVHRYNIVPQSICIEITESDLITNKEIAVHNVLSLRAMGFSIAIDDFGAGLASFEYLNQFTVDILKLDGQFISDIAENPKHQAIVRSMVDVARSYQLKLVAEFVDSQAAKDCLQALGVDYAQGYFIGKPEAARGGS